MSSSGTPMLATNAFRLTSILRGHGDDVKAVATGTVRSDSTPGQSAEETVLSASRDETGRMWTRSWSDHASTFSPGPTVRGKRYANAIAQLSPCDQAPVGQVLLGSLDALIRVFEIDGEEAKLVEELNGHHDNITSFDIASGSASWPPTLLSGSWDSTARVWELCYPDNEQNLSSKGETFPSSHPRLARWKNKYTLKGHPYAVWGVAIVDARKEEYLTTCADGFVRRFVKEDLQVVYAGHTDVARAITLLPSPPALASEKNTTGSALQEMTGPAFYPDERLFVTCSNDTTLRVWSLDDRRTERPDRAPGRGGEALRVLRGHSSLVYDIAVLHQVNRYEIASCGEDGAVRIWDWAEGTCVASIPQPVLSVWSIAVLPFSLDIVTGSSDALIRIYSRRPSHVQGERDSVSEEELTEHNLLCEVVAKQVVARNTTIIATEREGTDQHGSKQEYSDGKLYDAILSIDVSDDVPPLQLPMNMGDDPQTVTDAFMAEHGLPASYGDQILQFVRMVGP